MASFSPETAMASFSPETAMASSRPVYGQLPL